MKTYTKEHCWQKLLKSVVINLRQRSQSSAIIIYILNIILITACLKCKVLGLHLLLKSCIMKVYNQNGELVTEGYLVSSPDFIPKNEYKETELDRYKRSVDFLITSCGNRYEIIFNKPVVLKETRYR